MCIVNLGFGLTAWVRVAFSKGEGLISDTPKMSFLYCASRQVLPCMPFFLGVVYGTGCKESLILLYLVAHALIIFVGTPLPEIHAGHFCTEDSSKFWGPTGPFGNVLMFKRPVIFEACLVSC